MKLKLLTALIFVSSASARLGTTVHNTAAYHPVAGVAYHPVASVAAYNPVVVAAYNPVARRAAFRR